MATATVTPQVNPTPAAIAANVSSAPTAESASSLPSPESTAPSSSSLGVQPQSSELSLQDFDSLQDYAQALIDKKSTASRDLRQSTANPQQSETADSSPADEIEQDRNDNLEADSPEPEEQPTEQGAQPNEAAPHTLDLDSEDFLSTKTLNDKINASPALKQALEADQPLRNAIFRNARLASEAAEYREIFPDVNSARMAAENAAEFAALDHAFLNADTRQGAEQFFSRWAQMAMLNDENGNPVRDSYGNPRMHGAWNTVNQHIFDSQLDYVRNKAEKTGDHELLAALDIVRDSFAPTSRSTELPAHLQAAADSIHRREQELTRRQQAAAAAEAEAFDFSMGAEASEKISALVKPVLEKAALSDFVRQTAQEKIESAIVDSLNRNRFFQARMAELRRLPRNDEAMQQQLNLIMTHVHAIAGPIVRQVLREAAQPVMKAQEDRRTKIEGQIARTRSEPRSVGGAAPMNGANQRPEQLLATARQQLRDELGDDPDLQQVIERFARLKNR
jgi:hypothetical protein